jgi:hypothetical protein
MTARQALLLILFLAAATGCGAGRGYSPRDGDIVFHTSTSAQSIAVQKATKSPYSHMGVVFHVGGKAVVLEAVEPARFTPLGDWIARGKDAHYLVKRLRDADNVLTAGALTRLRAVGQAFLGKHYDPYFEWSDSRLYCSELVWKLFDRALRIKLGSLQRMSEFDLSDPVVQAKVRERWKGGPPADEVVISPAAMAASGLLITVFRR